MNKTESTESDIEEMKMLDRLVKHLMVKKNFTVEEAKTLVKKLFDEGQKIQNKQFSEDTIKQYISIEDMKNLVDRLLEISFKDLT